MKMNWHGRVGCHLNQSLPIENVHFLFTYELCKLSHTHRQRNPACVPTSLAVTAPIGHQGDVLVYDFEHIVGREAMRVRSVTCSVQEELDKTVLPQSST